MQKNETNLLEAGPGRLYTPMSLPVDVAEKLVAEAKRLGIGRAQVVTAALVMFFAARANGPRAR